jgi:hypothetical protein
MPSSLLTVVLAVSVLQSPQNPPALSSQPPQPPAPAEKPEQPALSPDDLPVSLGRIQRELGETPVLRTELDRPVFRTEVIGRKPTIEDILGPDFAKGRPNYGGMTHQEFLDMVTPNDVRGYAAFSNGEAFTVAATSFLLQWALQKAVAKFRDARTERQKEEARREVQEALRELERARAKAGLPPR